MSYYHFNLTVVLIQLKTKIISKTNFKYLQMINIILYLSFHEDEPSSWETNHECHHDASENGFAFDPNEICFHKISDVNVYAICLVSKI